MVVDPIPQSLPVHFFGSRTQPPTSRLPVYPPICLSASSMSAIYLLIILYFEKISLSIHMSIVLEFRKDLISCARLMSVRGCDIPQIANSMSHQKMGGTAIYQIRLQGVFAYKAASACLSMTQEDERVKHAARMRGKSVFFSATRCVYYLYLLPQIVLYLSFTSSCIALRIFFLVSSVYSILWKWPLPHVHLCFSTPRGPTLSFSGWNFTIDLLFTVGLIHHSQSRGQILLFPPNLEAFTANCIRLGLDKEDSSNLQK